MARVLLPASTDERAVKAFGEEGAGELVFLVGGYGLVSVPLDAFDVSVAGREKGLPSDEQG